MADVKKTAAERARKMGLPYAGALLPAEAHELMQAGAKLVDVRTKPELLYVGSIPGAVTIEWQTYPGSRPNPEFLGELAALTRKAQMNATTKPTAKIGASWADSSERFLRRS